MMIRVEKSKSSISLTQKSLIINFTKHMYILITLADGFEGKKN